MDVFEDDQQPMELSAEVERETDEKAMSLSGGDDEDDMNIDFGHQCAQFWKIHEPRDVEREEQESEPSDISLNSSPTPSIVELWGICECPSCASRRSSSDHYPPSERAARLEAYQAWQERRRRRMVARTRERREREWDARVLQRERAMRVVGLALGLGEEELEGWKEESWERWIEGARREIDQIYGIYA